MQLSSLDRLAWILICGIALGPAASRAADPNGPSSHRATREEAARLIPFDRMNEGVRNKIGDIVTRPSIFRRMPTQTIDCDPDLYLFLVRNPEVVVNMWQIMGATQVSVQRTGPYTAIASDGAGTTSNVELLYGTPNVHVLYGDARYDGPLVKKMVTGKVVMVLHSNYVRTPDERIQVTSRLDVFISLDQAAVDLVAKTLQPLFSQAADTNFTETIKFLGQVSKAAETNGPAMQQRLVPQLTRIQPAVRDEFARVAAGTYQRAVQKAAAAQGAVPTQVSSLAP